MQFSGVMCICSSHKVFPSSYCRLYTELQKSCTTFLYVILFQTLMAFENNELSMNGQVISTSCYAPAVKFSCPFWRNSKKTLLKSLILTKKNQINRISVERFGWFVSVMAFVMREREREREREKPNRLI